MTDQKSPDESFPFHLHCSYCTDRCRHIETSSNYVMVTNVWNESRKVEGAFQRLSRQSKKPLVWLWLDDGSVDGTYEEILRVSRKYPELRIMIERMPKKDKGDINTIGNAYTRHMPGLIENLKSTDVQYFTIQDVGTNPCPNYYARIMTLMNANPRIGASSGYMVGEEVARESGMPMGDCKVTRWEIISRIERYWPLSPDTFVNIKALSMGYGLKIWRVPVVQDGHSYGTTAKGMFYQGQLNYYVGRPFLGVAIRAFRRLLLRRYGTEMLRGYMYERQKGTWRCDDTDVLSFYGHGRSSIWVVVNLLRTRGKFSD